MIKKRIQTFRSWRNHCLDEPQRFRIINPGCHWNPWFPKLQENKNGNWIDVSSLSVVGKNKSFGYGKSYIQQLRGINEKYK